MTTRSIVTSVPDVACDVCGRRLLRGERPEAFIAGHERRVVCELCAPRATAGGWMREADSHSLTVRPPRSRRARSLLGRLRQLREQRGAVAHPRARAPVVSQGSEDELESELYEFLDRAGEQGADDTHPDVAKPVAYVEHHFGSESEGDSRRGGGLDVAQALEVFNAGEQPRRVAGVSRSLGVPAVTVRPLEDSGGKVAIIVAWELCWYRYVVDLSDDLSEPRLLERGMELEELPAEDRLANAVADERGELALLA